jgi:oxalate decarboxylase/phosphoglucose isomerase-like protein (cupin superfamily)
MLGREFNKTLGHFHKKGQGETYQIIFGKGLFLLQDRQNKIKMVKAETGDSLQIPPGYAHTLINLGKTVLVAADNSLGPEMNDYLPILAKHGFFYYVLKEGNRIKLVKNSAY